MSQIIRQCQVDVRTQSGVVIQIDVEASGIEAVWNALEESGHITGVHPKLGIKIRLYKAHIEGVFRRPKEQAVTPVRPSILVPEGRH